MGDFKKFSYIFFGYWMVILPVLYLLSWSFTFQENLVPLGALGSIIGVKYVDAQTISLVPCAVLVYLGIKLIREGRRVTNS